MTNNLTLTSIVAVFTLLTGTLLSSCLIGCSSIQPLVKDTLTNPQKIAKISQYMETVSSMATSAALAKNPDTKQAFLITADSLALLSASSDPKPETLLRLLNEGLKAKKADTYAPLVMLAIQQAYDTYRLFYIANEGKVETLPALKSFACALSNGIRTGVGGELTASALQNALTIEELTLK